jgi:hypothetical protein
MLQGIERLFDELGQCLWRMVVKRRIWTNGSASRITGHTVGEPLPHSRCSQRSGGRPQTASRSQLRKAPHSALQPIQLIGNPTRLLQHRQLARFNTNDSATATHDRLPDALNSRLPDALARVYTGASQAARM